MINTKEILALSYVKGIGDKSLLKIIDFFSTVEDLDSIEPKDISKLIKGKRGENLVNAIQNNLTTLLDQAQKNIYQINLKGISIIPITDRRYPHALRLIKNPPPILYCKGNLDLFKEENSIAIIGTRGCTDIGYKVAQKTSMRFADKGFNIVSGLALGIDTAAHVGALKMGGLTTAALVDVEKVYPKENKNLANEILENGGLLFSENAPNSYVGRGAFVARDRLQSGLSLGVFTIETDIEGGTMHTVNYAKDQNRLLFCPDFQNINDYDLSNPKHMGVKSLIDNKFAQVYSISNYAFIEEMIQSKREELYKNSISKADEYGEQQRLNL